MEVAFYFEEEGLVVSIFYFLQILMNDDESNFKGLKHNFSSGDSMYPIRIDHLIQSVSFLNILLNPQT